LSEVQLEAATTTVAVDAMTMYVRESFMLGECWQLVVLLFWV
jgi:hypothetical protein